MHVLFITSWFETPSRPTAGKAVKDLALALHQQGISISILFQSSEKLPWQTKSSGIDIYHSDSDAITNFYPIANGSALKTIMKSFGQYSIEKGKPDLIHVHSYASLALGYELNKKFNIPFIYTEHSSQIAQNKIGILKRLIIKHYINISSANFAVSSYLKESMHGIASDCKIISNTIDFDFFSPIENRNSNQLIMINLLNKNKQVEKGIETFKTWKLNRINARMYIIGDGPEKLALLKMAKNENIEFMGEQRESQWIDILKSSACLLLMSISESFGVVVLEALACGVPVVCFDNGGVRDIIKCIPNTSMLKILDSSASYSTIAGSIDESIKNYSFIEAIRVREALIYKFNYKSVATEYIRTYTEIVKK